MLAYDIGMNVPCVDSRISAEHEFKARSVEHCSAADYALYRPAGELVCDICQNIHRVADNKQNRVIGRIFLDIFDNAFKNLRITL